MGKEKKENEESITLDTKKYVGKHKLGKDIGKKLGSKFGRRFGKLKGMKKRK